MRRRIIAGMMSVLVYGVISASLSYAAAEESSHLRQYIAPVECTRETIHDGITSTVYLSPDDCRDEVTPESPSPSPSTVGAPNTGHGILLDGVSTEDGIVVAIVIIFVVCAYGVRRRYRQL